MKRLLFAGAALAAAATLAACGGTSDTSDSPGAAPSASAETVSVEQLGGASVLVDPDGKALYASDQEHGGMVLCTGPCTSFWTPLTIGAGAPTGDSVPGQLGVVMRPDGTRQLTLDGKLLYSFSEDQPGEVTGDGFEDTFGDQQLTWHVIRVGSDAGSSAGTGGTGGRSGY